MFTIGDFAKLGRVSVRMLRHYDATGLLIPAAVDAASGYRYYNAGQLGRLNRIIALKDLGFTLQQVRTILDDEIDVGELRGMLRLRRAQLEAQLSADAARLAGVEARLRIIETEGHMNTEDVVLKPVAPLRIAELADTAAGYGPEHISPVIVPMYPELFRRLEAAGVTPAGPAIAYYEPAGDAVTVHAGMPVATGPSAGQDFAVVDLPAISAATIVHHGHMDDVMGSLQTLARWIEDNGYRPVGYHREVYLDYHPDKPEEGVTELQVAVTQG
ncbi:MerR family transcriptional regulator [Rugosimonospora africana]|uniref:MerR family transcriptional regulator n=1 Tax=Rugosimonospora africana TaxID=556532 RepID=A0A8J3VRK4_9ACTN|nr:MerR family transcriptional regulator [Rugosimonospora africana]GIH16300.1 MerR family transcriptional regulator [Rugosimonospora africana]